MLKWSAVDGLSQGDVPVNEVDRMTIPVGRLIGHGLRVQSIASLVLAGVLLPMFLFKEQLAEKRD